jgi:hypothetical protein
VSGCASADKITRLKLLFFHFFTLLKDISRQLKALTHPLKALIYQLKDIIYQLKALIHQLNDISR